MLKSMVKSCNETRILQQIDLIVRRKYGSTKYVSDILFHHHGSKPSYIHNSDKRPFLGITMGQLIDAAPDRFGDRWAVIERERGIRKTYSEYVTDINNLALGFLALNLKRGDRIAIWSPNRYEWTLTQLAASKAGLILATINPAYQPSEFEYCLKKLGIRAVVTPETFKTQNYYEMIKSICPEIAVSKPGQIKNKTYPNFDTLIMMSDKDMPGAYKFTDVMTAGGSQEKSQMEKLKKEILFDDAVNIQFTSGTTGRPKAATLSHFNIINNCSDICNAIGLFNEPHRICSTVPLFHCFGCVGVTSSALMSGSCAVFPAPSFVPEAALKSIEEEKITVIYGTPTMFIDMLSHPKFKTTDCSSIKTGIMAGAPCPSELVKEVIEKMHCPGMTIIYGSTELSPVIACHHHSNDSKETKLKNVGKVIPNTEVKIVDTNNIIVPMGSPGEICARGYQVMKGYWDDEEKTKEVIINGWYHTGDIGTMSEDGYIAVIGRIKDMIIRGGENIYPREIEEFLIAHPKIKDAHVIGVPDTRMGEEVCVWIKINDSETLTEAEVKDYLKGKISHFKIPQYIRFVDDFPKTVSGKVQKFIMRAEMAKILNLKN